MDHAALDREVDGNFDAFLERLPQFLPEQRGRYALLRHKAAQGFFDTAGLALAEGRRRYPDGLYSIQEVTDRPVDLGFFSHAVNPRLA